MKKRGNGVTREFAAVTAKRLGLKKDGIAYLKKVDGVYATVEQHTRAKGFPLGNPDLAGDIEERVNTLLGEHPPSTSLSPGQQETIDQDYRSCYHLAAQQAKIPEAVEVFSMGHERYIDERCATAGKRR